MKKFSKLKQLLLDNIENCRLKISTNPKIIIWRLEIFGFSPFLSKHIFKIIGILLFLIFVFSSFYIFSWRAPRPFPEQALITIERGESLSEIADKLKQEKIIRSSFWLRTFETLLGGEKKIIAGDYYFPKATNIFRVTQMLHKGEFGLISIKVTVPEGTSSVEMAEIFENKLPAFNKEDFLKEVSENNYEGYLFPDTYFMTPNIRSGDIILMMQENFAKQIKEYKEDILKSGKTQNEIVIMASIIEDEANGSLVDKRIVAGILWNRLRKKMPLQVDAPFQYYNGKNSYTLTKDDLAEDHLYNTYINKGLPPTAISNPGLDSLRAAIAPTNTDYLYFLSDKEGNMHYAKTFEEHKKNKELYLN